MKINEVFDSPYELTRTGPRVDTVRDALKKVYPGKCIVHQNTTDPDEFFIEVFNNGVWEVHHATLTGDGNSKILASGIRLDQAPGAKTRYIATAKNLLEKHIDRGHPVRIQSTDDMWDLYKSVMDKSLKGQEDRYDLDPVEKFKNSSGQPMTSQTLRPKNGKNLPEDFYKKAVLLLNDLD